MESAYPRRNASKEGARVDPNRFLSYSRLHPRAVSNPRQTSDLPRAAAIDARLATVYDKMKSNPYSVLTSYPEDHISTPINSTPRKDPSFEMESQRFSSRSFGFTQATESLSRAQADVFEILKSAKKIDEINLKAKLWDVFNTLSNNLWSGCFKGRNDEGLANENRQLKNTLDQMEEQVLRLKSQLQEKELAGRFGDSAGLKAEIKRVKEFNKDLQMELNQKLALIQSQEQQLSILRHEMRNKDADSESHGLRGSYDLREKLLKITQERDALKEWKTRFSEYPSTYEKAIQRMKEEHLTEKERLQDSINQLQSLVSGRSPLGSKTASNFFPQSERSPDPKSKDKEALMKKEIAELKQNLDFVLHDYESVCGKFKLQGEQFDRAKAEYTKTIDSLMQKLSEQEEEYNPRPGGIAKGKKQILRAGREKNNERDEMIKEIEKLERDKEVLEEDKKKLEEIVENDEGRLAGFLKKIDELKMIIEQQRGELERFREEKQESSRAAEDSGRVRKAEENELIALNRKVVEVEEENREIRRTSEGLSKKIEEKNKEFGKLKEEIEKIKGENRRVSEDMKVAEENARIQVEKSRQELIKASEQSVAEIALKNKEIARIEQILKETQDKLDEKQSEIKQIAKSHKDKVLESTENAAKFSQLTEENEILLEKLKRLEGILDQLEVEKEENVLQLDNLQKELNAKTKKIKDLLSDAQQGESDRARLVKSIEKLKKRDSEIKPLLSKTIDENKQLEEEVAEMKQIIQGLEEAARLNERMIQDKENSINNFESQLDVYKNTVEILQEELKKGQSVLMECEIQVKNKQNQIDSLEDHIKKVSDASKNEEKYVRLIEEQQKALKKTALDFEIHREEFLRKIEELNLIISSEQAKSIEAAKRLEDSVNENTSLKSSLTKRLSEFKGSLETKALETQALETLLSEFNEKHSQLLAECEGYKERLKEIESIAECSEHEVHEKNERIKVLEFSYSEYKEREKYTKDLISKHEKENMKLQSELDSQLQECIKAKNLIKQLKDDLGEKQNSVELLKRIQGLEKEKENLNQRIAEQNQAIESLSNRISQENEVNEEYEEKIEGQAHEISKLTGLLTDRINEIQKLQENIIENERRLEGITKEGQETKDFELEQIKGELELKNSEVKRLIAEIKQKDSEISSFREIQTTHTALIEDLKFRSQEDARKFEAYENSISILSTTIAQEEHEKKQLSLELDESILALEIQNSAFDQQIASLKSAYKEQSLRLSDQSVECENLASQMESLKQSATLEKQTLLAELEKKDHELAQLLLESAALKAESLNSSETLKSQQENISSLTAEISELKLSMHKIASELSSAQLSESALQQKASHISKEIASKDEDAQELSAKTSTLESEISKISKDLSLKLEDLSLLQSRLSSSETKLSESMALIQELQKKVHSLEHSLESSQSESSELASQLKSAQESLNNFDLEKKLTKSKYQQSIGDLESKHKETLALLQQRDKALEDSRKEIEKYKQQVEAIAKEYQETEYSLMKVRVEKSGLENAIIALESTRSTARQEIEDLQRQIRDLNEEVLLISELRTKDLKEKNQEVQELKRVLAEKVEEMNQIENELNKLSNSSAGESEEGRQTGAKSLWKHVDHLTRQLEDKNNSLSQKDTVINALNRKIDEANEALQLTEITKHTLEVKLKSAESSDLKLKSAITSLEENLNQLRSEKESLEESSGKEILELKAQKRSLEKLLADEKEKHHKDIEELQEEHARAIESLEAELHNEAQSKEDSINRLLAEKNASINKLESKIEELQRELERTSDLLDDRLSEIKSLESQNSLKEKQFQDSRSDFESISQQISDLRSSHTSLQSQNAELSLTLDSLKQNELLLQQKLSSQASQILEYEDSLLSSQKSQDSLKSSLAAAERSNQDLSQRLHLSEMSLATLQTDLQALESERVSLMESNKTLSKKTVHESDLYDFDRDLEGSMETHERKELSPTNFIVCKVVKYDNRTWCLVYVKSQNPEYNWYEKYILQEINAGIEVPSPYEEQLEKKLEELKEESQELGKIRELAFPEEIKAESVLEVVESLVRAYQGSKRKIAKPIKVISYEEEVNAVPASNSSQGNSDLRSDSMQVTAEEAKQFFDKMKKLEEENMDLENRIILLNQQLVHFKNEGRSSQNFASRSETTVEQLRGVIVSLFEKLPPQNDEAESNIKVLLEMMAMTKDAKERLMESRHIKNTPEKSSAFKKLFSKKKK